MLNLLGLFTGSNKWLYIALVALGIAFIGTSALSISLFADKTALHVSLSSKEGEIVTLKKEHKEAIDKLEEKLVKLQKEKEDLQDKVTKFEALSAQERADAKRNAAQGTKKLQEVKRTYDARMKRFEDKIKGVKDYGESDTSIVDSSGI